MAITSRLQIYNLQHVVRNVDSIYFKEIRVWTRNQYVSIASISTDASTTIPNLNKLITANNQDLVEITLEQYHTARNSFKIFLNLDQPIDTAFIVDVQIFYHDYFTFVKSFDLAYAPDSTPTTYRWFHTEQTPGDPINQRKHTLVTTVNQNVLDRVIKIIPNTFSNSFTVHNEIEISSIAGSSGRPMYLSPNITSGKWYFEIYEGDGFVNGQFWIGILGKVDATQDISYMGSDGESYGFYRNEFTFNQTITPAPYDPNVVIQSTIRNYTVGNNKHYKSLLTNPERDYAILIDADEKTFTVRSFSGSTIFKAKIPFTNGCWFGFSSSGSGSSSQVPIINTGYRKIKGRVPKGYKLGLMYDMGNDLTPYEENVSIPIYEYIDVPLKYAITGIIRNDKQYAIDYPFRYIRVMTYQELEALGFYKDINENFEYFSGMTNSVITESNGFGYIKSSVRKGLSNPQPLKTIVVLFDIQHYRVIASTFSDPETGQFEFTYLDENRSFNIMAFDPQLGWVTAIAGPVKPKRMPGTENIPYKHIQYT